jgi:hypothetical protein
LRCTVGEGFELLFEGWSDRVGQLQFHCYAEEDFEVKEFPVPLLIVCAIDECESLTGSFCGGVQRAFIIGRGVSRVRGREWSWFAIAPLEVITIK